MHHTMTKTLTKIIQYINFISSCSFNEQNKTYVDLQIHKHSKTGIRKIANKKKCRFSAPWPPLDKTQILYPLEPDELHNKELHSKTYDDINKFIQTKNKNKNKNFI